METDPPLAETAFRMRAATTGEAPLLRTRKPDPCMIVLFGATGDLAARKLVPALYELASAGALPENVGLVGFSRSATSDEDLRRRLGDAVQRFARRPADEGVWSRFAQRVHSVTGSVGEPEAYRRLAKRLDELDEKYGTRGNRLFYLATPPSAFPAILEQLGRAELVSRTAHQPWSRVIIEKPFGRDLATARELNELALDVLNEEQVYRIDHYLGKETVQNILVFRFGNTIFEPLWNRNHIDHVQLTMAESIGVEGRGRFYEETGVVRDVVQNHLLQVLALCAMEPPVSFDAEEVRNMKAQVLRSLRPVYASDVETHVVRGQYDGYRDEAGVAADSNTPTYVALKTFIDNWRWQGVPFYLRAGKGLRSRVTEVTFHFRSIPHCLFGDEETCALVDPNVLKIRIQPDEGISWHIASKVPGEDLKVSGVTMDFRYADAFPDESPEAYERLLLDCMRGDPTLFARRDEVEMSWGFVTPILEAWERTSGPIPRYPRGGDGPAEARELLARDGHRWERLQT